MALLGMAVLVLAVPAAAQVEACDGPLQIREWTEAMDAVDASLVDLDGDRADRILDDIIYEMRCVQVLVAPAILGRLARQVALVAFFAQDPEEMRYWGLLARETLGGTPWPEVSREGAPAQALPIPPRFFDLLDDLPNPVVARAEGGLAVPRGGGALLDGYLVVEPVATVGVQHLLQVADKRGRVVQTRWQTGAMFDEEWIGEPARPPDVPKWYVAPPPPPPLDNDGVVEAPEPVPPEPAAPEPAAPEPAAPEPAAPEPAAPEPAPERVVRFDGDGTTADCPWKVEPRNVVARGGEVRVNRHTYPVRSAEDQGAFKRVLRSCGEFRAARRFIRWRAARRAWFRDGTRFRLAMIEALLTPEPARKAPKD